MRVRKISRLHQDLINIIWKVSDITNIKDIEYFIEFGTQEIDYFLSGIHRVDIKGFKNGALVKVKIIIKWHSNPVDRSCFRASYQREYTFYQHVAPRLIELQRRYKIIEGLRIKIINCILASKEHDKETVVIYCNDDYKLLDRFRKVDLDHSLLVMKDLAKLHALSFVLQVTEPDAFAILRTLFEKDIQYSDVGSIPKSLISYFKSSINVVKNLEAKKKLESISPKILSLLNKCSAPVPKYSTICHGDCWNNNIIFKYQGRRPVDVLLVDYQLIRYASPATDISYYLYMSTDEEFLSKHYHQLIDVYYGTLSAVLRQCNLNVDNIYPKTIFEKHLREYSVLGLIEAMISMKIITAETEEVLKMTKMRYLSEEPCQYEMQNQTLYEKRVNGVVTDFFKRNYSLDALLCE